MMTTRLALIFVFILLSSVGRQVVCQKRHAFGIYTLTDTVDARVFHQSSEEWKSAPLQAEPIFSEDDIVVYDFSKHAFQLTDEAFKRLPRPPVTGIPFVVVANDERIYPGAFWSSFSSIPCDVPVIVANGLSTDQRTRPNTVFIERAYPKSFAHGKDLRSDERLRTLFAALKKLGAL